MACQVEVSGTDYYVDCDRVEDLEMINGYLVNTSSSSITLKNNYGNGTTYPYISCSSMSACYLRQTQNSNSVVVTSPANYKGDPFYVLNFNHAVVILLFFILGIKILWKR